MEAKKEEENNMTIVTKEINCTSLINVVQNNMKKDPQQIQVSRKIAYESQNLNQLNIVENQVKLKRQRELRNDIELKDQIKPQIKKKRKLLSFEDEIQGQGQISKKQRQNLKKQNNKIDKNLRRQTQNIKSVSINQENKDQNSLEDQFKKQYLQSSEKLKQQIFQISYSYWDGKDVVKKIKKKKKQKISDLLDICRLQLIENFQVLAKYQVNQLLFVIKDFIVPHHMTIAQLQLLNVKTRTGEPILDFRRVKMKRDSKQIQISVNFGGAIRIIQKSKYQKNKIIYPFLNWHTLEINKGKS